MALREIAALLGCAAPATDVRITGVAALDEAGPQDISFITSESYLKAFKASHAGAVLVQKKIPIGTDPHPIALLVDDADLALVKVLEAFAPPVPRPPRGTDATARVDQTASVGKDASIGAYSIVGARSRIGAETVIHPHVYISDDVEIGENCEIFPNVTIRERIQIGSRVIIHAGSVLGTDGFGYRWDGTKQAKIPQIGTVIVEDDVEIGSCVCVDRAKFSVTRIGRGTKIDNLVQIAHNVTIGPHTVIAGQAGLAGSATLGAKVVLGGQVALRDHVQVGDGAMIAACAAVANDVAAGEVVAGMPALPHRQALREQAAIRRLPDLVVQVRKLEEAIKRLDEEMKHSSGK
jgi:UDP-3-O-[3-hydroxymyristoyl] glucosamine N-acyltransferase